MGPPPRRGHRRQRPPDQADSHDRDVLALAEELEMHPSPPTATSASASSTRAPISASRPTSTSPPRRGCTARWRCASGSKGRGRTRRSWRDVNCGRKNLGPLRLRCQHRSAGRQRHRCLVPRDRDGRQERRTPEGSGAPDQEGGVLRHSHEPRRCSHPRRPPNDSAGAWNPDHRSGHRQGGRFRGGIRPHRSRVGRRDASKWARADPSGQISTGNHG